MTGDKLTSLIACGTEISADTGDVDAIAQFKPRDATTNPSLIYQAAQLPQYAHLTTQAIEWGKKVAKEEGIAAGSKDEVACVVDCLAVTFGLEILKIVPGYVSTEIDARLSFDTEGTIKRAERLMRLYGEKGVSKDRVLLKIASTWEGFQAAAVLEKKGFRCNLTLLFCFEQAVLAAQCGVTLISPFVGRITDWFKNAQKVDGFTAEEDPGVLSVRRIYNYYKTFDINTIVMGASFRNKEQIIALSGCDKLTVGPKFLEQLQKEEGTVPQILSKETAKAKCTDKKVEFTQSEFLLAINNDQMAIEKLSEGIRKFCIDIEKLEAKVSAIMQERPAKKARKN